MMKILRSTFRPFTALGTYLQHSRLQHPFLYARVTTALLYFLAMFVAITAVNVMLDGAISTIVRESLANPGSVSADEVYAQINQARWVARTINMIVFTTLVYLLLGHTLRPIQKLVESQRRFIANVSHELKTPLTVAKTEIQVALRKPDALSRDEAIELLKETEERINHLSRIVTFFLTISDFTAKHPSTAKEVVDLKRTIESVRKQSAGAAAERGIDLHTNIVSDRTLVRGNALALEKMLLNLVRNAISHTERGGTVLITLNSVGEGLALAVRDTGSGIPESDQHRVFEPFYRAGNAVPGGSGLGLAIVEEVARLHDAKLTLESAPEQGTTIQVLFKEVLKGKKH